MTATRWVVAALAEQGDLRETALDLDDAQVALLRRLSAELGSIIVLPADEYAEPLLCATLAKLLHAGEAREWGRIELVQLAVKGAGLLGLRSGYGRDPDHEGYRAYVDLPTGQISWHLPADPLSVYHPPYPGEWDGHREGEVAQRIAAYLAA